MPNLSEENNEFYLMLASLCGYLEVLKSLIEKVDVNIEVSSYYAETIFKQTVTRYLLCMQKL